MGCSIAIEPLPGEGGSAEVLYEELYSIIETNVRRFAKGKAYQQVTEDYLEAASEDGTGRDTEIDFHFRDVAGLCGASAHACEHWFRVLVSSLARAPGKGELSPLAVIVGAHGFRLTKEPPPLASVLDECEAPLVLVRGHLFGTGNLEKSLYLVSDDLDDGMLQMDDLTAKERAIVETAVRAKRCECRVCEALRAPDCALKLPKKAPATRR